MKKTLLIAAAALAASVISSQAQVYSQNIVGYYNVPVGGNQFGLIANQFTNTATGISDIFSGSLVSDVNGVNNTVILIWNPVTSQYSSYQYFSAADAVTDFGGGSLAGWWDAGASVRHNEPLLVGQSAFIQNINNASPITVTLVGTVPQGTNVINLNQGYTLVGSPVPVSTNIASSVIGFAGNSDVNGINNDVILLWNPVTSQYSSFQYFNQADAVTDFGPGSQAGFWDAGASAYQNIAPNVGSGFFIQRVVPGTTVWTNVFSVQ